MTTIGAGPASFSSTSLLKPQLHHHHGLLKSTPISPFKTPKRKPISAVRATEKLPARWSPDSWKSKPALQIPDYPDKEQLESVLKTLESYPPIVFAGEARKLEERLGEAARGDAFLLQGGDCAESFKEFKTDNIRDTFRLLLQMGVVLMFGGQMPVIKVGRMAGQFAKPRSDSFEEKDGVKLPSYRGDNVNGDSFDEKSRIPDPNRMIQAYTQSVSTLNILRAFATGGYAAMQRVNQWNLDFTVHSEQGDRYRELAHRVDEAMGFMAAAGLTIDHPIMTTTPFWTSHECLLLPYEQALTREDSTSGLYYDCSAHMVWVGERTRQLDGAHVEFLRGVANPLGIKVSDKMDPSQLVKLIEILNPHNKPGRITIISRMGADNTRVKLPHLIRAVRGAGQIVTWVSDPMHGNTIKAPVGLKTRSFDAIRIFVSLSVMKNCVNDAVAGEFRDRTTMRSVKVLKEIETDQESNSSSSEDMEFYSPKSVVAKKWPVTMKEVNVSRNRVFNPIMRIRTEEYQIGEDIAECFSKFDGNGNGNGNGSNLVDVVLSFSRPASPLGGKSSPSSIKTEH